MAVRHLAGWLTRNNRQFARDLANRTWFHLMDRGIVEPVDDFRESNPPSNPGLLEALTDDLVSHGMELKPLVALIMKSQTYQLEATPNPTNAGDVANFARARCGCCQPRFCSTRSARSWMSPTDFPARRAACGP